MDYTAIVTDILEQMRGNEVPDRFVRKIEFTIGNDIFEVMPEDFEEWRLLRPEQARNVHYHIDVVKLVASVRAEHTALMAYWK